MPVHVAVIYYSATGNVYDLARAVAAGAERAGAEVRLRRVAELAPAEAIDRNPAWRAHHDDRTHPRGHARGPELGRRLRVRHADPLRQRQLPAQAVPRHDGV